MFRLTLITIIAIMIGGGLYTAYAQPSNLPSVVQPYAPVLKSSIDLGLNGMYTVLSSSKNAQPAVMGVKTESSRIFQEDTAGKPIHQKAMEYTQYQYCKLVVKSFEEQEATASKPTPTPLPEQN